jgi:elongator complex protein 1
MVLTNFGGRLRYRAAFLACRRHRIDLNILYDHDPTSFRDHLAEFVSQVKDVDYLNLFLSGLKDEDVTTTMYRPLIASETKSAWVDRACAWRRLVDWCVCVDRDPANKVNLVCDLIRTELDKRDVFHYANTVLTAHVRKRPPDYESALKVLVELKGVSSRAIVAEPRVDSAPPIAKDAARAEDAVKYIIFLSDANKLFDLALGMYDFPLVLMIAQHSQKVWLLLMPSHSLQWPDWLSALLQDPREYLPFLRELRQLDTHIQRHKIDDHLERYDSALKNLALAGPDRFEEALAYTKKHELFTTALQAFRNEPAKYKVRRKLPSSRGASAVLILCVRCRLSSASTLIISSTITSMPRAVYVSFRACIPPRCRQLIPLPLSRPVYSLGGQPANAMLAYQQANAWQELFTLALSEGKRSASEIKALAVDVAGASYVPFRLAPAWRKLTFLPSSERLRSKRRFVEAGRVLLEYGRDVEAAVGVLVEGAAFAEALRLVRLWSWPRAAKAWHHVASQTSLYTRRDLIETHIKPGTLEVQSRLLDDFAEVTDQVEKQVERLAELKEKRDSNPSELSLALCSRTCFDS